MFARLLLLFIVTPLVELWLLLRIGDHLGPGPTILIVILTGTLGATLARRQGLQTWHAIQQETRAGRAPGAMLVDALLIFVAGLLLITPGVLTDIVGFSFLLPPVRAVIRKRLKASFQVQVSSFGQPPGATPQGFPGAARPQPDDIIDAEFTRHSDDSGAPPTSGKLD